MSLGLSSGWGQYVVEPEPQVELVLELLEAAGGRFVVGPVMRQGLLLGPLLVKAGVKPK